MKFWYITALFVLTIGSWWTWTSRVPTSPSGELVAAEPTLVEEAMVGRRAPDFMLPTLGGGDFVLSEAVADGTPVVLNFWATWCGPCERELPALQSTAEHYGERVQIVGINLDQVEPAAGVAEYVDQRGLTFTIPLDPAQETAQRYNIIGMPMTFFIDGEGTVQQMWPGEMNRITLAEHIEAMLP